MNCREHDKLMPHFRCEESERFLDHFGRHLDVKVDAPQQCRARTGVIWKLGGEVCSCVRAPGHPETGHDAGGWHVCSCGAWFDDSCVRWRPPVAGDR